MEPCTHKYVHLETIYKYAMGNYSDTYTRIDRFFCERCLHEDTKIKTETSRGSPDWWNPKKA